MSLQKKLETHVCRYLRTLVVPVSNPGTNFGTQLLGGNFGSPLSFPNLNEVSNVDKFEKVSFVFCFLIMFSFFFVSCFNIS